MDYGRIRAREGQKGDKAPQRMVGTPQSRRRPADFSGFLCAYNAIRLRILAAEDRAGALAQGCVTGYLFDSDSSSGGVALDADEWVAF